MSRSSSSGDRRTLLVRVQQRLGDVGVPPRSGAARIFAADRTAHRGQTVGNVVHIILPIPSQASSSRSMPPLFLPIVLPPRARHHAQRFFWCETYGGVYCSAIFAVPAIGVGTFAGSLPGAAQSGGPIGYSSGTTWATSGRVIDFRASPIDSLDAAGKGRRPATAVRSTITEPHIRIQDGARAARNERPQVTQFPSLLMEHIAERCKTDRERGLHRYN